MSNRRDLPSRLPVWRRSPHGVAAQLLCALLLACAGVPVAAAGGEPRVVTVAAGLEHPWSLAFLADGTLLVSERPGRLRQVSPGGALSAPVANVPAVHARGQGGLLDVVADPAFAQNRLVYISYAEADARGASGLAIARGEFDASANTLRSVTVIFRQQPKVKSDGHYGGRLVFARDGTLFATLGDRQASSEREKAQQRGVHHGKVIRIHADGRVPADNPFLKTAGALPEIFSLGHRNPQGAALHPQTGTLWVSEHGPQGGDEINVVRAGRNYGWPVITHGCEYVLCTRIGEGARKEGMEQPVTWWPKPSTAPSGLAFYTGERFPAWRGNLFSGALAGRGLWRLTLDGERVLQREKLLGSLGERIRDVRQGPDGLLYLLTDSPEGRVLRLEPADD